MPAKGSLPAHLATRRRVEPSGGNPTRHQGLSSGKATVSPKRTVLCGATGASSRCTIHSPVTKKFNGGEPSRGTTYPRPRLSGSVVGSPSCQPKDHVASADFTYSPRQRCRATIGWTSSVLTGRRSRDV